MTTSPLRFCSLCSLLRAEEFFRLLLCNSLWREIVKKTRKQRQRDRGGGSEETKTRNCDSGISLTA